MANITMTLTDTPDGGVSIHSSFRPAVGNPCTPAQGYALEIINRTHKQWGVPQDKSTGLDIDAVYRSRGNLAGGAICHDPESTHPTNQQAIPADRTNP